MRYNQWYIITDISVRADSPLCWKSACLREPWIPCGGGATRGGATGDGGDCLVLIGLEAGLLLAGLWLGERWVELFSDHASFCLTGTLTAGSAPAAMETAEPDLWTEK